MRGRSLSSSDPGGGPETRVEIATDSSASDAERRSGASPEGGPARTSHDQDRDVSDLIDAGEFDAALRLLMKRHGRAVYRYCCESLRDPVLAEDVQQRVFIEAYRDLRRYAGRSNLRSWLFGIVRHRVLDAAKARQRHDRPLDRGDRTDIPDLGPGVEERIDDARLTEALRECLERLGERVRTALLLRYQQGLTFEEMAEICGEKPGTLQARVARALPSLRDCIETNARGTV